MTYEKKKAPFKPPSTEYAKDYETYWLIQGEDHIIGIYSNLDMVRFVFGTYIGDISLYKVTPDTTDGVELVDWDEVIDFGE